MVWVLIDCECISISGVAHKTKNAVLTLSYLNGTPENAVRMVLKSNIVKSTLMEHNARIVRSSHGTVWALFANADGIDCLSESDAVSIGDHDHVRGAATYFRVSNYVSCRRASIHHKCMSKPEWRFNRYEMRAKVETRSTHLSRPSPTAIIRLLSPSHSRSFLRELSVTLSVHRSK